MHSNLLTRLKALSRALKSKPVPDVGESKQTALRPFKMVENPNAVPQSNAKIKDQPKKEKKDD